MRIAAVVLSLLDLAMPNLAVEMTGVDISKQLQKQAA